MELKEEIFEYLNNLRDSGITNMYGAGRYIQEDFGLDAKESRQYLLDWMESFNKK